MHPRPPLNRLLRACRLFAAGAFVSLVASAQTPATGAISGVVVDTAGKFLQGAEVQLAGTTLKAVTERDGTFRLTEVPAGSQSLALTYPGMNPHTEAVRVDAGATATVRVTLRSDAIVLEAFTVSSPKEGMAQAVALQKISFQAKLVAAADQFGPVSEGNIGEYLKFLPGVSIDYNVNDARGISLRGMSTAFTIASVDGTTMAGGSSTDDTRRFEFEQIAMNNVETTELYKTLTPDIPANATAGFVNFVTRSAFDHQDVQRISYDLAFSAPSSELSLRRQGGVWGHGREYTVRPNLDVNFARKLGERVGINVNYRFSEKYDDSPRTEFTWNTGTAAPNVFAAPRLQQYNIRSEQKLTHREAFASKLDYRLSDRTRLMVTGQWNWYDLNFTQRGPQLNLGTASTGANGTYTSGTGAQIQNNVLYREKYGTTWHFNGTATHEFANKSKLAVTPYWSRANSQYRDTNKGFISSTSILAPGATTYSAFTLANVTTLGTLPTITLTQGATAVPLDFIRNLANYTLSNTTGTNFQSRPWTAIDTKQGAGGDYAFEVPGCPRPLTLRTGFGLDDTHRYIDRPDIRGNIPATTGATLAALADPGYTKDVGLGFGPYQAIDPFKVWETFRTAPTILNAHDRREIDEKNRAVYLRGDLKLLPEVLVVTGVRWEKRTIDAVSRTGAPARARLATANLAYDSYYPSLSVKFTPRRQWVFRGGFSRSVGHPDYAEILPSLTAPSTPTSTDGLISLPAAGLKPYFTRNYDLAVDFYPANSGMITASVFRKDVSDFIVSRAMTLAERDAYITAQGLLPADFGVTAGTVRQNGAKSRLQGFEISAQQNLKFLPKPFDTLNIQGNFSIVDVDTSDADPFLALDTLYSQLRAVSPKTFNCVIGYRYRNFSTTLTNNWVAESLYGGFVNTNYFIGSANTANPAADTRLTLNKDEKLTTDIKVEYAFHKHFAAYFLVRNIFNTPRKEFLRGYLTQNQSVTLPYRYFEFGEPHLTVGVRGRF
ncbi:MAG: TonB-dependent receptor [Verrucomicrobia bacterium]|nr:TonB-dependent receptor [Verrucomicrobiota bacterium]